MNTVKYEMTTYTMTGEIFKHGFYKTKQTMRNAKEKQNLQYGAHLRAEVIEYLADGTTRKGYCVA